MQDNVFHLRTEGTLLLQDWKLNSIEVLIGASFVTVLVATLYEGLKIFRQWLVCRPLRLLFKDICHSTSTSLDVTDPEDACSNKETLQQLFVRFPNRSQRWRIKIHTLQACLHTLQVLVGYVLMLIVMTYNVWLGVAVVAGAGVGYMAFSAIFPDDLRLRKIEDHEKALDLNELSCQRNLLSQ